ncbi:MAG: beta-ketoacyl-[acyl-carrier-protein] synthase family protein [Sedimentisphaerales bacterium]|nr:beta-ketoacyl-[acyl-carrier-protein] synthase family protein [Sedimentisphaerales bacterium]
MDRVAITGVGIISCLGTDKDTVARRLYRGESAIEVDPERVALGFRSPLTTRIPGFDAAQYLSRKARKTMADFAVQAYAAAADAIRDARLAPEDLQNDRTGLIFGCDSSCMAAIEQVDLVRKHHTTSAIGSGHVFCSMTSNITMNLNALLGTQGACWTLSAACSSSGHAVGQAADLIRMGRQDRVICGGAQELNWQSMCSFDALDAFSVRVSSPREACRPFDADRDGLVPGGGAAALMLERYDLAKQRQVRILGEVLGYGFSSDGANVSVPSEAGLRRAMAAAIREAGLSIEDVDYICAHATATPVGDGVEACGIHALFRDTCRPAVSSLKGMIGHELWMAGAAQVAYCILMASHGFTAPNINFERPDQYSEKLRILTERLDRPPRTVLCNSAGFGGTNACLALRLHS